jgi:RNA polymerase sigma-70 factor (ECF subfamily)
MAAGKLPSTDPQQEANDRLLIEAAQKDPMMFAELYENNFERVYAFVARRVRNRAEAEDLTAEVFHKALANLPRYKWKGLPFVSWLLRIAANIIADRAKLSARESNISEVPDSPEAAEQQPALEDDENRARLFRQVQSLPADQQRVIVMRFAEEKTIREIAEQLGRSEGAIKQLQFRGLQNLRTSLGKSDG